MPGEVVAKALKVCIDRVLPQDRMRFQRVESVGGQVRAIMPKVKRWPVGSTLHVRFIGGNETQRALVREQAAWWTAHANLTFAFDDAPDAQIRVTFDTSDGAWSYVGTDNAGIPRNEATMNLGFMDGGTAAHEFGHAIGLAHEHQNPQAGIQWNEAQVLKDLAGPPNFWTPDQIRHNVLSKYSVDQVNGTTFDPKSIMLYFFPASWTLNGVATEANEVLSATDKSFIGSAVAYPKNPVATTGLTVNAQRRTKAAIGKAGESDRYSFVVSTGGRHIIATHGTTDVLMSLFGPDSTTDLIATDDDSGVSLNARIIADLVPGTYHLQVRHYRPTGTGTYTIRVRTA